MPGNRHAKRLLRQLSANNDQFREQNTSALLRTTLEATVPFRMLDLWRQGGPTQSDWDDTTAFGERLAYEEGTNLLFLGAKKGQTASMAAGLIRALAVASFVPGGVTFAGLCFSAGTPDFAGERRVSPAWLKVHLEQTDASRS